MAAPAIFLSLSAARRSASTTIGPREVFTRRAVGFMRANSVAPTRPRVLPLSTRWVGYEIRLPKQLVFRDACGADFNRPFGCAILTPGNHLHWAASTIGLGDMFGC